MRNLFKNEQSGRSMVEMLGVLAIIGVLSVGGIAGYSKAMAKFKLTKAQDQLTMMIMNIRTAFATSPGYVGLATNQAAAWGLVSNEMDDSNGGLIHAFGGAATVQAVPGADGSANGAFAIKFSGLAKESCVSLASSDWGADGLVGLAVSGADMANIPAANTAQTAFAAGTLVSPAGLPLSFANARAGCSSDLANSIIWIYN